MHCDTCRDLLNARVDAELPADEIREIDDHLASCRRCATEYRELGETHRVLGAARLRYEAPDLLKARIRSAIALSAAAAPPPRERNRWWQLVAAGVAVAAVSSLVTFAATRSTPAPVASELVASHVRSLMPGHLTDVVSTDQHNVKPWFNGRVDVSPPVPDLAQLGFTLVGGRVDYVDGRAVAVVVYSRRQHFINVYAWPVADRATTESETTSRNGYNLVAWRRAGLQQWVVSDLNARELAELVTAIRTM